VDPLCALLSIILFLSALASSWFAFADDDDDDDDI
jgi:hypothetical protein